MQGAPIFYSRPEPLSAANHSALGIKRIDRPWAFASKSNIVPVVVTEFPQTAISCPIIFAGDRRQPLAVVGVNQRENLFLKDDGYFLPGYYVPAYVRRYPFEELRRVLQQLRGGGAAHRILRQSADGS
jgi:hypothetical protein